VRVLTIGNMYPPQHLGGYELIWRDAVRYLRDRGHQVRVLTTDFRGNHSAPETEDAVHRELRWYWRDHAWPAMSIRDRVRLERLNGRALERHLVDFKPDVIGWWSMGGMSLSLIERARRRGVPAAGFVCEGWMIYGPRVDGWLRLARWPLVGGVAGRLTSIPAKVRLSDVGPWLFLSEFLRRQSAQRWGLQRTAVAHLGADREVFEPARRPQWRWRILYAGRIDPRKGVDLAVRALSVLPREAALTVVGDGDIEYLEELRELARDEGVADRVAFHPAEAREKLRDRYAEADALVFPVRWREPWGLVPLEAMAVGTPVVATGRGGSGEYLRDHENCLLFDPSDGPEALARALLELADDEQLRRRLTEGGAATSAAIGTDNFNAAVERTLHEAIGERP
jgi:glycosyltransferase involved in cell wall biosynthesis